MRSYTTLKGLTMFILPTILVVLNVLLAVFYCYLIDVDRPKVTRTLEKLRCETLEMDRKLIREYWDRQYTENK